MSKYHIYRIDHFDPALIGRHKRQIALFYAIMSPVFVIIFVFFHQILNVGLLILFFTLIPVLLAFYLYLYFKLKSDNRKIESIGDLEFTRFGIRKHIGDSMEEFNYKSIIYLELKKHIPAVTMTESKSGFFTHLLSITFSDMHKETLVVSDLPTGKWQDLSITETMKTLRKVIHTEIIIK